MGRKTPGRHRRGHARKTADIKVRVPEGMKKAIQSLPEARFTSEGQVVREALSEYLTKHNISPEQLWGSPARGRILLNGL